MQKYVLVTIFAAVLALCASTLGQDCSGHGELQNTACVCYSGYAPSTAADIDCLDTVSDSCVWNTTTTNSTNGAAALNGTLTLFHANNLTLVIQSPVVQNRTTTYISVGGSNNPNCIYPGVNFAKSLFGCEDTFTGNIPWSESSGCNFTEDTSDPDFIQYKAPIYVTNTQLIGDFRGELITQSVTDVFHITIQFQREISISTNTEVVAPVNMYSAVTDQSYSPTTQEGTIAFVTSLEWPFELTAGSVASLPTGLTVSPVGIEVSNASCNGSVNTTCFQQFSFNVVPDVNVCQLTGLYVIDFTVSCRGTDPCPLETGVNSAQLTLSLQSADFCAALQTGITATAQLSTFQDSTHLQADTAFLIGETGFFLVQVSSAQAQVTQTTVSSIEVIIDGAPTTLYTDTNGIADASLSGVAVTESTATFAVSFDEALFVVPTDQELSYSFSVTVLVEFAGNSRKRAVFATPAASKTVASSQVSIQNVKTQLEGTTGNASTAFVSYTLAGMLILCILFI